MTDRRWFTADVAPDLSPHDWELVQACRPRLAEAAAKLVDVRPATVQHDDLHDGNVFGSADAVRIIDWGDASLAHPFGTLLITLRVLASQLQCDEDARGWIRSEMAIWRSGGRRASQPTSCTGSWTWPFAPGPWPGQRRGGARSVARRPGDSWTWPTPLPSGWCGWPRPW